MPQSIPLPKSLDVPPRGVAWAVPAPGLQPLGSPFGVTHVGGVTLPPVLRRGQRWHRVPLAHVEGQSRGADAPAVSPPNRARGRTLPSLPGWHRQGEAAGTHGCPALTPDPPPPPNPGGVCFAAGICPAAGDAMTWMGGGARPGPPRDRRAAMAEGSVSDHGGTGGRSPALASHPPSPTQPSVAPPAPALPPPSPPFAGVTVTRASGHATG